MPSVTVKITSKLPDGTANGLDNVTSQLVDPRRPVVVAVVMLDAVEVRRNLDAGRTTCMARLKAIEPMRNPRDLAAAHQLYRKAYLERTGEGEDELPYEWNESTESVTRREDPELPDDVVGD